DVAALTARAFAGGGALLAVVRAALTDEWRSHPNAAGRAAARRIVAAARLRDGRAHLVLGLLDRRGRLVIRARRHLALQQRRLALRERLRLRQVEGDRVLADRRLALADVARRRRQERTVEHAVHELGRVVLGEAGETIGLAVLALDEDVTAVETVGTGFVRA